MQVKLMNQGIQIQNKFQDETNIFTMLNFDWPNSFRVRKEKGKTKLQKKKKFSFTEYNAKITAYEIILELTCQPLREGVLLLACKKIYYAIHN